MSVSSLYLSDDSLSSLHMVCYSGIRCRGAESWVAGMSLHVMTFGIFLSWCGSCGVFQRYLAEPFGVVVYGVRTYACCSGGASYRRQKPLTRNGCAQHCSVACHLCMMRSLTKKCW